MAFNRKTFQTRTLTAVVFVAIMLAGLLWNHWSFLALFSIIHFGCWGEYFKLTEKIHQTIFHPYTKLGLMVIGYGLLIWFCGHAFQINGYGLKENISLPVTAAGFAILIIGIFQKTPVKLKAFAMALGGLLYISLTLGLMVDIYGFEEQFHPWVLPLAIIIALWINDTMAYLVGSLIGKTPMSKISPKKTWEGTIGGIILSTGVGFLIPFLITMPEIDMVAGMVVALAAAITGTIGDLFESKLKRMAGVKDSGSIMPGHGGFLDRFDSLLFAIPVCWLLLYPCLMGPC